MPNRLIRRIGRKLGPGAAAGKNKRGTMESDSLLDQLYEAKVTKIRHETSRAVSVEFELLDGYRLKYKAGQFVNVSFPLGAALFQRCYSFSSAPEENRYTITIQKVFKGRISSYAKSELKVGDKLYIDEPDGAFVTPDSQPESQRYIMIAAGAGVVPIFSLVKDLLGKNSDADIQMVYVSRDKEQALFLRELERLKREHSGFTLRVHYTRSQILGQDQYGRLDSEALISELADPANANMYLCGPYGLIRKCAEGFERLGLPKSKIKIETFSSTPASSVVKHLKPHSITFLPSGLLGKPVRTRQQQVEPILDSARDVGVNYPQDCSIGNCQACKVKIHSGILLMEEPNGLTISDAKNGYVLGCAAYPCTPVVARQAPKS